LENEKETNDEEVIKLLKIFASDDDEPDVIDKLARMSLNLIQRLQTEKAELKKQVDGLKLDLENWKKAAYGYKYAEEQAIKNIAKEVE
jgi:hypothetical protein